MVDRPKVTQRYLNKLELPADMPPIPYVQWRVENLEEVDRFLEDFHVRIKLIPGDQLLVQGHGKMSLQLSPGDCLVLWDSDGVASLGYIRAPGSYAHREGEQLATH